MYLLNRKSFDHESWPTNNKSMGNILRKCFDWFEEVGPKPRPFLIYQPPEIN